MHRSTLVVTSALLMVLPSADAAAPSAIIAETVADRLDFPAAFTFAPDGRIFYGELETGEVRVYDIDHGTDLPVFQVPGLLHDGERGLLGLAFHPDYPATPYLFLYATRNVLGTPKNQVLRLTIQRDQGRKLKVIFTSNTPSSLNHNGGRILFGPDGNLYVAIGDAETPANAQDVSKHAGKMLRMTAEGTAPPGNPIPGSLVWARGIRNTFGFAFDPVGGGLWEMQNGPSCNDEINRITAGTNYAWGPSWTCTSPPAAPVNTNQDGTSPTLPQLWYTPTIAPTGGVFCADCGLSDRHTSLYFGAVNTGEIRRTRINDARTDIVGHSVVYTHPTGILSMELGTDGLLYFSSFDGIFRLVEE